jgi:hypothetical protein
MIVNVNSINRSSYVIWSTFVKIDSINNEVDTCSFSTRKYENKTWKPEIGDTIEITDGATKIFSGKIVEVDEEMEGAKLVRYLVKCNDWTYVMDKRFVAKAYENNSPEAIIYNIISIYCPDFTVTNVSTPTGITLEYILFNYEQISKCIQQIAELIGYDWYVDCDKDIHFFSKSDGETAGFNLTDTNGYYDFNSLKITEDYSQLRNVIYVRGGEYVGSSREDKVGTGDGVTKSFKLPYRYTSTPTVAVGVTAKTVGIDYLDSEDDYDCLWNYQEKIIKFKTAPASGDVKATGSPLIIVLIKASRGSSRSRIGRLRNADKERNIYNY